jgi:hypothetical protein
MYTMQEKKVIKSRVYSQEIEMDIDDVYIKHTPTMILLATTTLTLALVSSA